MRTGFKEHLLAGLVVLAVLAIAVQLFHPKPPMLVAAASFAFLLGSLLPDVDAPVSLIRRALKALLFLALLLACLALIFIYYSPLAAICKSATGLDAPVCTGGMLLLALALPAAAVMLLDFLIPFHRGVLHGFLASFIYGALLSSIAAAAHLPRADGFFITLAGMLGYVLHIVVDLMGDMLPGKK